MRARSKVLLLSPRCPPETDPTSVMVAALARDWAEHGHLVTVVTGYPHHPQGRLYPGFRRRWRQVEAWSPGVIVHRGWHLVSSSPELGWRGLAMATQALGAGVLGLLAPVPDVVVSVGPPLIGPLVAWGVRRWHQARWINVVHDRYPDVAITGGHLRDRGAIALARQVETLQYRQADHTVVLGPTFRTWAIQQGARPDRVAVLPPWLPEHEIMPGSPHNPWRARMGIDPELKVVLYAGTVGWVAGAEVLLEAASKLRQRRDVLMLVVGEGQRKAALAEAIRAQRLTNIRLLPRQLRKDVPQVLATADVTVVTLGPGHGHNSLPSKVIAYFAAGRPVVASVDPECDTAHQVRDAQAGLVCPPGDGVQLAAALECLLDDAPRRRVLGRRARQAFEETYTETQVLPRFRALLDA